MAQTKTANSIMARRGLAVKVKTAKYRKKSSN